MPCALPCFSFARSISRDRFNMLSNFDTFQGVLFDSNVALVLEMLFTSSSSNIIPWSDMYMSSFPHVNLKSSVMYCLGCSCRYGSGISDCAGNVMLIDVDVSGICSQT